MLKHLHVFTVTPDLLVLIASKGLEYCISYPCAWFLPAEIDVDDGFNQIRLIYRTAKGANMKILYTAN